MPHAITSKLDRSRKIQPLLSGSYLQAKRNAHDAAEERISHLPDSDENAKDPRDRLPSNRVNNPHKKIGEDPLKGGKKKKKKRISHDHDVRKCLFSMNLQIEIYLQ